MPLDDLTDAHLATSKERCILVKSPEEAHRLLEAVKGTHVALDFETTSLSPDVGEIRLTSVCNDEHHFLIDHYFVGGFEDFAHHFPSTGTTKTVWWVFNAKFEVKWLDWYCDNEDCIVYDIDFAKKAKMGGQPNKLLWMAKDIGVTMDKDEQNSDWGNPRLSQSQYDYAGFDSHVTWELKKHWWDNELNDDHRRGFHVFNDSVRGTIECEDTGLTLDYNYHKEVVRVWQVKQRTFERYLRKWVGEDRIKNLQSDVQVGKFLEKELPDELLETWPRTEKTSRMQLEGKYLRSVGRRVSYPFSRWLAALAGFKYYNKYLSTYGQKLLDKQVLNGKITSRFNIAQAATGRYSSSNDNLQNIPRKPLVRKAFYVLPNSGKLMTLADYSGIEVRVLAELSQDENLLHDAIYGDVHAASAAQIYGHDLDHVISVLKAESGNAEYYALKEQRSVAKGFTFQLTYGAGAGALSDVLRCTYEEAIEAIQKWAERYPQAYAYRDKMFDAMNNDGFLPVCDGRTIYVRKNDRSMPVAANYPIQGAAASVMYRAVYHVRERFLRKGLDAYLAASVHDELLAYAHKEHADEAMSQQVAGMTDAWLDIFPGTSTDNLIEHAIGTTWAAKP